MISTKRFCWTNSGFFYFYDVDAGSYTVSIDALAVGPTAQPSTPNVGSDETVDSDGQANGTIGTVSFEMLTNFAKLDYDFEFYAPSAQPLGTRTPGYWKNQPDAWPDTIVIGGNLRPRRG